MSYLERDGVEGKRPLKICFRDMDSNGFNSVQLEISFSKLLWFLVSLFVDYLTSRTGVAVG